MNRNNRSKSSDAMETHRMTLRSAHGAPRSSSSETTNTLPSRGRGHSSLGRPRPTGGLRKPGDAFNTPMMQHGAVGDGVASYNDDNEIYPTRYNAAYPARENRETGIGRNRPLMFPEHFSGDTSWDDYQVHFEAIANLNGWNRREKAAYLVAGLRGPAQKTLADIAECDEYRYEEITELLKNRFGAGDRAELYLAELRCRVRNDRENLREYGQAIQRLTNLAYPELPNVVRGRMARIHFADGMNDAEMRVRLFQAQPASLEEAITIAMEVETFRRIEATRHADPVKRHVRMVTGDPDDGEAHNRINKIENRMGNLEKQVGEITAAVKELTVVCQAKPKWQPQGRKKEKGSCFNCGSEEHWARECPMPRKQREQHPGQRNDRVTQGNGGRLTH